jgi:hypothetical protein
VPPWDVAPSWAAAALPPAPAAPWAAAPLSSFTVTVARVSAWALAEAESPCDEEDVTQASQAASHYSNCSKGSHAKSIAQPCCPLPSVWADRTCAEAPAASTARRRAASAAAVAKPFMALLCDAIWRKDEVLGALLIKTKNAVSVGHRPRLDTAAQALLSSRCAANQWVFPKNVFRSQNTSLKPSVATACQSDMAVLA